MTLKAAIIDRASFNKSPFATRMPDTLAAITSRIGRFTYLLSLDVEAGTGRGSNGMIQRITRAHYKALDYRKTLDLLPPVPTLSIVWSDFPQRLPIAPLHPSTFHQSMRNPHQHPCFVFILISLLDGDKDVKLAWRPNFECENFFCLAPAFDHSSLEPKYQITPLLMHNHPCICYQP